MKKIILSMLATCLLWACGSDSPSPQQGLSHDERPAWQVAVPREASVNMSIFVKLPVQLSASEADMMAAFHGDECRAIGYLAADTTFVLTVKGTSEERTTLHLRYYNATLEHIFSDSRSITFAPHGVVGLEEDYIFTANE